MNDMNRLTGQMIGCAIEVYRHPGPGLLDVICEAALCIEWKAAGLTYKR